MMLQHDLGKLFKLALEGIVKFLRDVKELLVSPDDLPARFNSQISEYRHHPLEDFGYASACTRGIDVKERPAL